MHFDQHIHSHHSHDGKETIDTICREALEKGISGIAITDHCNFGTGRKENPFFDIKGSMEEFLEVKEIFKNRIFLSFGIEIGQALQEENLSKKAEKWFPYDVILASVHSAPQKTDYCGWQKNCPSPKEEMGIYLKEVLKTAEKTDFDILAHITYPWRYFENNENFPDPMDYEEILKEIFKILIERGKALELNVSGFHRIPRFSPLPCLSVLKLYCELGGEMISMGTDSHIKEHVGKNLTEGAMLLKSAGFKYETFYQKRKPKMFKL